MKNVKNKKQKTFNHRLNNYQKNLVATTKEAKTEVQKNFKVVIK